MVYTGRPDSWPSVNCFLNLRKSETVDDQIGPEKTRIMVSWGKTNTHAARVSVNSDPTSTSHKSVSVIIWSQDTVDMAVGCNEIQFWARPACRLLSGGLREDMRSSLICRLYLIHGRVMPRWPLESSGALRTIVSCIVPASHWWEQLILMSKHELEMCLLFKHSHGEK